jgi:hypothetical protein
MQSLTEQEVVESSAVYSERAMAEEGRRLESEATDWSIKELGLELLCGALTAKGWFFTLNVDKGYFIRSLLGVVDRLD